MIKSMTGFGAHTFENHLVKVITEVRAINSKTQDFSVRLPKSFQDKETELKTFLSQSLERGKVSVNIEFSRKGGEKPRLTINKDLFRAYYADLEENAKHVGAPMNDALRLVLQMPEVYEADTDSNQIEEEWEWVLGCVRQAVHKCNDFRVAEGAILQKQLEDCIDKIRLLSQKIAEIDADRLQKIRQRMYEKVAEHVASKAIDESRFEQELIYYIEKLDISEEKVRLNAHLDYFLETMHSPEANGKKLGFIAQEIGREINTTGAKANDAQIQRWVVEMKDELEKIKEQSMNVL